jgi:hypothetical protein
MPIWILHYVPINRLKKASESSIRHVFLARTKSTGYAQSERLENTADIAHERAAEQKKHQQTLKRLKWRQKRPRELNNALLRKMLAKPTQKWPEWAALTVVCLHNAYFGYSHRFYLEIRQLAVYSIVHLKMWCQPQNATQFVLRLGICRIWPKATLGQARPPSFRLPGSQPQAVPAYSGHHEGQGGFSPQPRCRYNPRHAPSPLGIPQLP